MIGRGPENELDVLFILREELGFGVNCELACYNGFLEVAHKSFQEFN
jgi:hypothetical protein